MRAPRRLGRAEAQLDGHRGHQREGRVRARHRHDRRQDADRAARRPHRRAARTSSAPRTSSTPSGCSPAGCSTGTRSSTARARSTTSSRTSHDPSKGYELVEFDVHGKYEIAFTRTQLKIKVRIKFTGETPDARHLKIWGDGIAAQWNEQVPPRERAPARDRVRADLQLRQAASRDRAAQAADRARGRGATGTSGRPPTAGVDTTDGNTAAHEFGHLFGLADEYNLRAADFTRLTGQAVPAGPAPASGYTSTTVMGAVARAGGREALRALRGVAEPEVPQAGQALRAQARAMSADLLIAYTRSGGAPPATLESLRVHADGSARAIVTNAWPDGAPQDEAGLYETTLGDDVLAELRALAADPQLLGPARRARRGPRRLGADQPVAGGRAQDLGRVRRAAGAAAGRRGAPARAARRGPPAPAGRGPARARAARRRSSSSWR